MYRSAWSRAQHYFSSKWKSKALIIRPGSSSFLSSLSDAISLSVCATSKHARSVTAAERLSSLSFLALSMPPRKDSRARELSWNSRAEVNSRHLYRTHFARVYGYIDLGTYLLAYIFKRTVDTEVEQYYSNMKDNILNSKYTNFLCLWVKNMKVILEKAPKIGKGRVLLTHTV